jgi:hypothetical protein
MQTTIARTVKDNRIKLGETVRNTVLFLLENEPRSVITPFKVIWHLQLMNTNLNAMEIAYLFDEKRIRGMISLLVKDGRLPLVKVAPNTWKDVDPLV